ncbi:hypothetical protein L1049_001847 [Liquidambar formosana]|uniref:Transmembrane 9 superfamily member n=1 Tax=Liquidambar formosana TaxID=63359 RepID=A0AAP0NEJ1_LIQFO
MEKKMMAWLAVAVLVLCSAIEVRSDASDHRYKNGEPVPLYANKVGPFHNPSETYRYFDLPFCSPGMLMMKSQPMIKKRQGGSTFMVN